jgi:Spy/CpxP family protein refolding chaperone
MKRTLVVLLIMVFCLSAFALAQQDTQKAPAPAAGKMDKMQHMGMMRGNGDPGAMMGLPKLTDEQKTKIQDLRLSHQKEIIPLRADLQKLQASMKLELTADKFNESKVKSLQADISKVMNEIASKSIVHMRTVRDLLAPEQKKAFDQRILSGGMMGEGKGMRGGMMGPQGGMKRGGRMAPGQGMGMHQGMPGMGGPMMGGQGMGECKCENKK